MQAVGKVIVKVKKEMNDKIGSFLLASTHNETQHANLEGEIVSVPENLGDDILQVKYEGRPFPKVYVGGEHIEQAVKKLNILVKNYYEYLQEVQNHKNRYSPTTFEEETIYTVNDQINIIDKGDTVYFHYLALGLSKDIYNTFGDEKMKELVFAVLPFPEFKKEKFWDTVKQKLNFIKAVEGSYDLDDLKEVVFHLFPAVSSIKWNEVAKEISSQIDYCLTFSNFLYRDSDGNNYYRIDYSSIHAVYKHKELVPVNGKALVIPKIKDEDTQTNIIAVSFDTHETLTGIVKKLPFQFGDESRYLKQEDTIIYKPDSEFKQTLRGQDYFVMRYWDIIAKIVDDKPIPLGKWVLCEPLEVYPSELSIKDPVKYSIRAKVITTGHDVTTLASGDEVGYRDKKLSAGSSYLYLVKYGKFFIREEDILYKCLQTSVKTMEPTAGLKLGVALNH